jgi:hypothetical protein
MEPINPAQLFDTYQWLVNYVAETFRVVKSPPPNPERERIVNKMHRELIAHDVAREIARSLPPKKKRGATNNPQKKSQ